MKTLAELLRQADPLGHEPDRSSRERLASRLRVLRSRRALEESPRRWTAVAAVAAVILIAVAAGAGYWSRVAVDLVAAVRFEVRLAEHMPADGLREAVVSGESRTIYLHRETVVTNGDIAGAQVIPGEAASTFSVTVTFNAEGAAKMLRASQRHIGGPLAILVDGNVVIAPVVRSAVTSSAVITGRYTRAEAERIVAGILGR